jgi:lysyl-tRNA synthetase, class I
VGARNISEEDVPLYMDEYDQLEDLYFGKAKESNPLKDARLKGLYFYSNLSSPASSPPQHVSYRLLVELAKVAPPENPVDYIEKRLLAYRAVKSIDEGVKERIKYALNWSKEFSLEETKIELTPEEKKGIQELGSKLDTLSDPNAIQTLIFDTARSSGLESSAFFRVLYLSLLGVERGPRLGPYIVDAGPQNVAEKLRKVVSG